MKSKNNNCLISFIGKYQVSVLSDERIILPVGVISQLEDNGIKKVLVGKLPEFKALILCPETLWSKWIYKIKRKFPCLKTLEGARTFLIPWQSIHWDTKGSNLAHHSHDKG